MLIKFFAGVAYVAMVATNFLANSLPINNRSTGEVSDAYFNLFTPAGFTFSIWGLIYLLLAGYVVYQMVDKNEKNESLFKKINILFIATCLANILWIFAWHYGLIGLSVLIMLALLFLLVKIADILRVERFSSRENFLIKVPFSVYFGWITVATIANITVLFVSLGWGGFGIADYFWTSIILLVGALIGVLRVHKDKNIVYGLVFVWAYLGILFRHISADGLQGQYPSVIVTLVACVALFLFFIGRTFYKNK